ncbi:MAG TPA: SAP domain-containing protein [Kofleriaceae bacterium]|jgi:hypothetical protein|nr:SAP domain-containing protein [Kofleriaceae bacterium]
MKRRTLSPSMTEQEFDNGYWYATEIKKFAMSLGIRSTSALRKDELEAAIKAFLRTGKVIRPTRRSLSPSAAPRDSAKRLRLDTPVVHYTNDKATKDFLVREARKLAPDVAEKSGARYRLNRWREQQLANGIAITYGDLVEQFVALSRTEGRFAQAPSGRYINFLSDYLRHEKAADRADAIRAWKQLKTLDIPKTYRAWKQHRRR